MKKFLSIILYVAVVLTTGCSGVSQEDYNSLVEENSQLKADNERILSEKNDLAKEKSALQSEKDNLKQKYDDEVDKHNIQDYCEDISNWMLGRPQSSILKSETSTYDENVNLETTYYYENSIFTAKLVYTIKNTVSPLEAAVYISSYEKAMAEGMTDLMDDTLEEFVIIYRHSNGSVIKTVFWYKDGNNAIQRSGFFTLYGQNQGIADEYNKITSYR